MWTEGEPLFQEIKSSEVVLGVFLSASSSR
jgi:hypothetical protein